MSDDRDLKRAIANLDKAIARTPKKTFATAKAALLAALRGQGWTVQDNLKVPHATSPNGTLRLWFKPQAVYLTTVDQRLAWSGSNHHDFKNARTLDYTHDIRTMSVDDLIELAESRGR